MEIRDRNHTLKQQNNELSRKNDELNMSLKAAQKKIRDLENERQSFNHCHTPPARRTQNK